MTLTVEQQAQKDAATVARKREWASRARSLAREVRNTLTHATEMLGEYSHNEMQPSGANELTDADLSEFPIEPADLHAWVGLLAQLHALSSGAETVPADYARINNRVI